MGWVVSEHVLGKELGKGVERTKGLEWLNLAVEKLQYERTYLSLLCIKMLFDCLLALPPVSSHHAFGILTTVLNLLVFTVYVLRLQSSV